MSVFHSPSSYMYIFVGIVNSCTWDRFKLSLCNLHIYVWLALLYIHNICLLFYIQTKIIIFVCRYFFMISFMLIYYVIPALQLPYAGIATGNRLYSTDYNYMDFNVDELGLWVIYSSYDTNNTLVAKVSYW